MADVDQQAQGLSNYKGRLLNHVEMVYRPGERHLVTKLFTALGCQVIDSGATHLYIAVATPEKYGLNNALYASEVTREQWALEEQLQKALQAESPLAAAYAGYDDKFRRHPQLTSHFGIRYPSFDKLEERWHISKTISTRSWLDASRSKACSAPARRLLHRSGDAGVHQDRHRGQRIDHLRPAYRTAGAAPDRLNESRSGASTHARHQPFKAARCQRPGGFLTSTMSARKPCAQRTGAAAPPGQRRDEA